MDELITVGQIIKAQGLKGEVKVKPLTYNIARFKKLRAVTVDTALLRITSLRITEPFVYITFSGVDTRDKAESLRNKLIQIDRIHAKTLDEGEFFITDLVNASFSIDNVKKGTVKDIMQNGGADIFVVLLDDGSQMMFPFLNMLQLEIDVENSSINVSGTRLESVAVINQAKGGE